MTLIFRYNLVQLFDLYTYKIRTYTTDGSIDVYIHFFWLDHRAPASFSSCIISVCFF